MNDTVQTAEKMAGMKIALAMYNDKEIEEMLEAELKLPVRFNCYDRDRHTLWGEIEKKASVKWPLLPEKIKKELWKYIRALHLQACGWMNDHRKLFKLRLLNCYRIYKKSLCWRNNGMINRIETVKKLVRDKNIDCLTRFELACTYFLEEEILRLWHEDKGVKYMRVRRKRTSVVVRFWMEFLWRRRKTPWKAMVNKYFERPSSPRADNPVRISSFFPYLSFHGKFKYLPHLQRHCLHEDDLVLCLQTMDEAECAQLLHAQVPANVLFRFLKWPHQSRFMEMANRLLSRMDAGQCSAVLDHIILFHILKGEEHCDYVELFMAFWSLIPDSFKDEIKLTMDFKAFEVVLKYDKENTIENLAEAIDKVLLAQDSTRV